LRKCCSKTIPWKFCNHHIRTMLPSMA